MSDNTTTNDTTGEMNAELFMKLLDLTPAGLVKAKEVIDGALAIHTKKEQRVKVVHDTWDDGYGLENLNRLAWSLYGQMIYHRVLPVPLLDQGSDEANTAVVKHIETAINSFYLSLIGAGLDINQP